MTTSALATVTIIDDVPTTTTRDIAEAFGKRHDNVLTIVRARMAEAGSDWGPLNFKEASIEVPNTNGGTVTYPVIRMTEKGFMFVVQKFTGKRAVGIQIAYVDEFERMRDALSDVQPEITHLRAHIAQLQAAALSANTRWASVARYRTMGLTRNEIARLMGCSLKSIEGLITTIKAAGITLAAPAVPYRGAPAARTHQAVASSQTNLFTEAA